MIVKVASDRNQSKSPIFQNHLLIFFLEYQPSYSSRYHYQNHQISMPSTEYHVPDTIYHMPYSIIIPTPTSRQGLGHEQDLRAARKGCRRAPERRAGRHGGPLRPRSCSLVNGISCMNAVYGISYMVYDIWHVVFGIWCLVYGIWYVACGTLYVVFGVWCMVYRFWYTVYSGSPKSYDLRLNLSCSGDDVGVMWGPD